MAKLWHKCIDPDRDLYQSTIANEAPPGFFSTQTEAYIKAPELVVQASPVVELIRHAADLQERLLVAGLKEEANTLVKYAAAVGSPEVDIAPGLSADITEAVNRIKSQFDPNFFSNVSKIDVLVGGPFGQVSSDDPTVVKINLAKIKQEVKRQLDQAFSQKNTQYDAQNKEHQKIFDEALTRAIVEVLSHETGHVDDYKPEDGKFPGGEAVADQQADKVKQRLEK